jgi:hypothetical protein
VRADLKIEGDVRVRRGAASGVSSQLLNAICLFLGGNLMAESAFFCRVLIHL